MDNNLVNPISSAIFIIPEKNAVKNNSFSTKDAQFAVAVVMMLVSCPKLWLIAKKRIPHIQKNEITYPIKKSPKFLSFHVMKDNFGDMYFLIFWYRKTIFRCRSF